MDRSQKGAVIQAANNELSHTPTKPDGMDDDFYNEAYAGCYIGYTTPGDYYNGNCAFGDSAPTYSISGFVSDINNITPGSYVGHRLNVLDLRVDRASFGYCNRYTALSMYYNDSYSIGSNTERFYAYPSVGYFPMQNFYTNEYWSIVCTEGYNLSNMKIEFTYNATTYEQTDFHVEDGYAIVFKMPQDLITALGGNRVMPVANINLKLTGLEKTNGDIVNYDYDVNFFDINEVVITGISFDKSEDEGAEGTTKQALELKVNPSNTTETYSVLWSSSNTDVATIDESGKITLKSIGSTIISAKVGTFEASYTLNVKEAVPDENGNIAITSVNLDKVDVTLNVGENETITASVLPTNTTENKDVEWTSSNEEIAKVENGKIIAVAPGNVIITAKAGNKTSNCNVMVKAPLTGITLNNDALSLLKGADDVLKVNYLPENTTDSKEVIWTSSNGEVATIESGKVIALKAGETIITAKVGEKETSMKVTVPEVLIESIDLKLDSTKIEEGASANVGITTNPTKVTEKMVVTFVSSDENIAKVDENGKVLGISKGKATIYVSVNDTFKKSVEIEVIEKIVRPDDYRPNPYTGNILFSLINVKFSDASSYIK